jgi:uncharacterized membrane protein YdbT with pleckstrin-like domain
MEQEPKKMRPIWYFIGLMLSVMGLVVVITGMVNYASPEDAKTVLADLHPEFWWGAIMIVAGLIFLLANRKASVD